MKAHRTGNMPTHLAAQTQADARTVQVTPGASFVSKDPDVLVVTVLGSCVAACMRDPISGVGGMNHFMLPHDDEGLWGGASRALRFGNHAMESLINTLLAHGAVRSRLECKLFGGGNVMQGLTEIGERNAAFARRYCDVEGIRVVSADLGGARGRRVVYAPVSGRAFRRFLQDRLVARCAEQELTMRNAARAAPPTGGVDLFDEDN